MEEDILNYSPTVMFRGTPGYVTWFFNQTPGSHVQLLADFLRSIQGMDIRVMLSQLIDLKISGKKIFIWKIKIFSKNVIKIQWLNIFSTNLFYFEINFTKIWLPYNIFIILFSIKQLNKLWKKTFLTIHQLSCFVGHPVF